MARAGGRRPGTTTTRDAILGAARELFGARGYEGTTIRGIATQAGVDPALVHHFFGNKEELFLTVLQVPETVIEQVPPLIAGDIEHAGERLARFYLGLYEAPETQAAMLTAIRTAVGHDDAARLLRDSVSARLIAAASGALPDRGPLRMGLAMSHLAGLAIGRYIFRIPPVAQLPLDEVVAWVGPTIQRYLTGPVPDPAPAGSGPVEAPHDGAQQVRQL
jgi:AcrR family transcriptional regulator